VSLLDAADYAPNAGVEAQSSPQPELAETVEAMPGGDVSLPSPPLGALTAMRAKMRQTQLRATEDIAADPEQGERAGPDTRRTARWSIGRSWSNFLLAGGVTLFAAIGYLLVDGFTATSAAPRRPAAIEFSAQPAGEGQVERVAPAATTVARIEAIGSVMAAVFRRGDDTAQPAIASTASIHNDANPEAPSPTLATLPLTIGPASLRQAALRGDAAAQLEVGARFATGQGVKQDVQEAFHWYGRAAAQGLAIAQYRYAALYERGLGTARDPERARVWYARAAEQGNVKAMHNLAVLSASASRSDYATAAKWFAQAADLGFTDSQVNLAILYQRGLGVPKNMTQAYKWLTLAGQAGDREAARRVSELKSHLGIAELEAADALVASWHAGTPNAGANEVTPDAAASGSSR
jgi:TPR repeat protein